MWLLCPLVYFVPWRCLQSFWSLFLYIECRGFHGHFKVSSSFTSVNQFDYDVLWCCLFCFMCCVFLEPVCFKFLLNLENCNHYFFKYVFFFLWHFLVLNYMYIATWSPTAHRLMLCSFFQLFLCFTLDGSVAISEFVNIFLCKI